MKIEKFQNLNQLSNISRKILSAVRKDDNEALLSLLSVPISNKILTAGLEEAVMSDSQACINTLLQLVDIQAREAIAFNCLTNNDIDALSKLKFTPSETISFLNKSDEFLQTNLHKIFDMAESSTCNHIINEYILKSGLEKNIVFTTTRENENILHTGIKKNITALSKLYDYIDINYFLAASSIDSYTPLHLTYACDKDFFIKTLNKCAENGVNLDIFNKFGSTPLTSLIRHDKLDLIRLLFNHYTPDLNHDKYNSYPLHTSIGGGHEYISLFLMSHGADIWKKNKIDIDSFWLSCRFFKKNKKVFNHILNSLTQDKIEELNLNSSMPSNVHRDYIKILAQHASLEALTNAYDKGLKENNEQLSHIISSALKSNQSNQKEKLDFLINQKNNNLIFSNLDELYKNSSKFSYIKPLTDSFILEFIKNHAPTKVVGELKAFIKNYNIELNSLDWTMAIYQAVNQGNSELFNYALKQTNSATVLENIKKIQTKYSSNDLTPILDIKNPEKINNFIKQSDSSISEILIQMIGQEKSINSNQKTIQEILIHNPNFFNILLQKVYDTDNLNTLIDNPEKFTNLIEFITVSAEKWSSFLEKFIPILKTWPKAIIEHLFSDELFMNRRMNSFSQQDLSYFFDNHYLDNYAVQKSIMTFSVFKSSADYSYEKCAIIEKNINRVFATCDFKFKDLLETFFLCAEPQYLPQISQLMKASINKISQEEAIETVQDAYSYIEDRDTHNWNRLKISSFYDILKFLNMDIKPYLKKNIKSVNSGNNMGLKNKEQKTIWHLENYTKNIDAEAIKDMYASCFCSANFLGAKAVLDKYSDILGNNTEKINLELLNNMDLKSLNKIDENFMNINKLFNISKSQFLTGFIESTKKQNPYTQLYLINKIQTPFFKTEFQIQLFSDDDFLLVTLINKDTHYLSSALEYIKNNEQGKKTEKLPESTQTYVDILDTLMNLIVEKPKYWNSLSAKITNQEILSYFEQSVLQKNIDTDIPTKKKIKI